MTIALAAGFVVLAGIIAGNVAYLHRHRSTRYVDVATYAAASADAESPGLSVLIPARNEEANIGRAIRSILSQDHPSFELLVYDDGSEDDTRMEIDAFSADPRLRVFSGEGPPPGWVGKVHALYQVTRHARGDRFLFLDSDIELTDDRALRAIEAHHASLPDPSVLTALPRLRGGGQLLVSLVPHIILMMLPWFLVSRIRLDALGALNGQCWLIDADVYRRFEPHERLKSAVLEDVEIGRYLKSQGVTPVMADMRDILDVYMYRDLQDAWGGLSKNAYLIVGGNVLAVAGFLGALILYAGVAPVVSLWFAAGVFLLKGITDRIGGFPVWVSLLMPLSYLLATAVLLASTYGHLTGSVEWKGRNVASR
jgi:glycosyltransferase involved in cell wall biosynthesis